MKRYGFVIGTLLMLGMGYSVASAYIGERLVHDYNRFLNSPGVNNSIEVIVHKVNRGVFRSSLTTLFKVQPLLGENTTESMLRQDDVYTLSWDAEHSLHLGNYALAARVTGQLTKQNDPQTVLAEAVLDVDYEGNINVKFVSDDGEAEIRVQKSTGNAVFKMSFPSLKIATPSGTILAKDATVVGQFSGLDTITPIGYALVRSAEAAYRGTQEDDAIGILSARNIDGHINLQATSSSLALTLEEAEIDSLYVDRMAATFEIDTAGNQLIPRLRARAHDALTNGAVALLSEASTLRLTHFSLESPDGRASAQMHLIPHNLLVGHAAETPLPSAVRELHLDATIDTELARTLLARRAKTDLVAYNEQTGVSQDPAAIRFQSLAIAGHHLRKLVEAGILKREGEEYSIQIRYHNGSLVFNEDAVVDSPSEIFSTISPYNDKDADAKGS